MTINRFNSHATRQGPVLIHVVIIGLMTAACGRTDAAGPEVDHAKLSAELEARAAEVEAEADASVAAVEQEMAAEIAEMREDGAAPSSAK